MGTTQLGQTFDATQVEPNTGPPPPLPTDWYNVMITDGEMKPVNGKPNNAYAEVVLKVMDGPYAGRQAWDRINLYNDNPVAVEIAQKTLSAICHAVGVFQVNDLQQLFGKPLMARIVEKDPEGNYEASNDVKGYAKTGEKPSKNAQGERLEPRNSAKPSAPATPGAPAGGAPTFNPPWAAAANPTPEAPTTPTPPPAPAPAPPAPPAQPPQAPAQPANPAPPAPVPTPPATPPAPTETPAPAPATTAAPVTPPWAQQ